MLGLSDHYKKRCSWRYSGLDFVVGDGVGGSGEGRSRGQVSVMFGKEWRWRRNGGYGFVRLVLDAHHDWKNIDGGEDKVGIGRRVVGGLLMD